MSIQLSDSTKVSHSTIDAYGSTRVTDKTSLIDIKSIYGTCHFRDHFETTANGVAGNDGSRFTLSVTGGIDSASIVSSERGTYVAGFGCEMGIGLQVDNKLFTGDQTLKFGYFDDSDGFYFQLDKSGISVNVIKGGSLQNVPLSLWNGDHGNQSVVDMCKGLVYTINFTYYGHGSVLFGIAYSDVKGAQINRLLHSYAATEGLSCNNPNLPISVVLASNGSTGPITAYIGGRQFSILGKFDPQFRVTSFIERGTNVMSGANTVIASYTKNGSHRNCAMFVHSVDVFSSEPVIISFRTDPTLTGATFLAEVEETDCIPGISGLTRDTAATVVTGGLVTFRKLVPAGYSTFNLTEEGQKVHIDRRIFSVLAKALLSSADMTLVMRIKEMF